MQAIPLDSTTRYIAGAILISITTIEIGGWFLTRVIRGKIPMTSFQKTFARAGHAHAGVLVTLSLVCLILVDASSLDGFPGWIARLGVPMAAILIPAGFFFSSMGKEVTKPNKLIWLIWIGAISLASGVVTAGIGLLIF